MQLKNYTLVKNYLKPNVCMSITHLAIIDCAYSATKKSSAYVYTPGTKKAYLLPFAHGNLYRDFIFWYKDSLTFLICLHS